MPVLLPLDHLQELWPENLRGVRLGALLHPASVSALLRDVRSIGAADSVEFYRKQTGTIEIPDSDPGFYRGKIKQG